MVHVVLPVKATPEIVKELSNINYILRAVDAPKQGNPKVGNIPQPLNSSQNVILLPPPKQHIDGNTSQLKELFASFEEARPLFNLILRQYELYATDVSGNNLNCFIYSLLQHATLQYGEREFSRDIIACIKNNAGINPNISEMRYSDTPEALRILQAINSLYKVNLEANFFQIDRAGVPIFSNILFDPANFLPRRSAVIWQQPAHYVAICSAELRSICLKANFSQLSVGLSKEPQTPKASTFSSTTTTPNKTSSILTIVQSPVHVNDAIGLLHPSKRPSNYHTTHLLSVGYQGTVYQLLVLLSKTIQLLRGKETRDFEISTEINGYGCLDDIGIVIKEGKVPIGVEAYQVKHYKNPISIYDFFNPESQVVNVDSEETEEKRKKKTRRCTLVSL